VRAHLQAYARSPVTLWNNANFLKLWVGQTVSLFGSRVTVLALPLTAVLTLHASPAQMGLLAALQAAPPLLFGLFVGAWADRTRRRPLMIAADIGRALVLAAIPVCALLGVLHLWVLYLVASVVAALTIAFDVAYSSYLPSVVAHDQLMEANSKLQMSDSVAQVAGPGLGGALVAALTAPIAILFDAISFVGSAASIAWMSVPEVRPEVPSNSSLVRDIRDGLGVVFGDRYLRPLVLSSGTFNLFDSALFAIYTLYMVDTLHLNPGLVGLVLGLGGLGGLAGASLLRRLSQRIGVGHVLLLGIACASVGELVIALASGPMFVAFGILVLAEIGVEFGATIFSISSATLRQARVDTAILGRVGATVRTINQGVGLIGALAGGVLAETLGIRQVIIAAGIGTGLAVLWVLNSPLREIDEL
jgi:MFS family permease